MPLLLNAVLDALDRTLGTLRGNACNDSVNLDVDLSLFHRAHRGTLDVPKTTHHVLCDGVESLGDERELRTQQQPADVESDPERDEQRGHGHHEHEGVVCAGAEGCQVLGG